MRARDVMRPATVLSTDAPASDLVQAFRRPDSRAVAVVSARGDLIGLLIDEDLLYALLPSYVLDDEALVKVLEEDAAGELQRRLEGKRVQDVVQVRRRGHEPVDPEATLVEVAATMVRAGDPAVLVVEDDRVAGVITADSLLPALLGRGG